LGIEQGGLRSAEALLLARYMMFSQVYYHKTRIIFDFHLKEFISLWLQTQQDKTAEGLLKLTDNEVFVALEKARSNPEVPGHSSAKCLLDRQHFRLLYQRNPADDHLNSDAFALISRGLKEQFGDDIVHHQKDLKAAEEIAKDVDFPVHQPGSPESISSLALSQVLQVLPQTNYAYLYVKKDLREAARQWLNANKNQLLQNKPQEEK